MFYLGCQLGIDCIACVADESQRESNEFVEGLAFSRDDFVIMTGHLTDNYELSKVCF